MDKKIKGYLEFIKRTIGLYDKIMRLRYNAENEFKK